MAAITGGRWAVLVILFVHLVLAVEGLLWRAFAAHGRPAGVADREAGRAGHRRRRPRRTVRPELVVEIAYDGLQRSTRYPAGVTLRFARVLRYRDDKTAQEADTVETVLSRQP
ncbi:DNA ligase [Streptomyces badius]